MGKHAEKRLTLFKECAVCGKSFVTTAETPFKRTVNNKVCYYCSESCKRSSYKHLFDGKAWERRKAREEQRDVSAKNKRYYEAHKPQELARAKARYWADPERARADQAYQRRKRRLEAAG